MQSNQIPLIQEPNKNKAEPEVSNPKKDMPPKTNENNTNPNTGQTDTKPKNPQNEVPKNTGNGTKTEEDNSTKPIEPKNTGKTDNTQVPESNGPKTPNRENDSNQGGKTNEEKPSLALEPKKPQVANPPKKELEQKDEAPKDEKKEEINKILNENDDIFKKEKNNDRTKDLLIDKENETLETSKEGERLDPNNQKLEVTFVEFNYDGTSKKEIKEKIPNINIKESNRADNDYHAKLVVFSFLDDDNNSIVDDKDKKIDKGNFTLTNEDIDNKVSKITGIINASFGKTESDDFNLLNPQSRYFDKRGYKLFKYTDYYTTEAFQNEKYIDNKRLVINALGNNNRSSVPKSEIFFNDVSATYNVLSPELQKLYRSETISVAFAIDKNEAEKLRKLDPEFKDGSFNNVVVRENGKDYVTGAFVKDGKKEPWTLALNSRAFTVAANGFYKETENKVARGTSFSAPRVTRIAYEVKKKFPFLSYQQIKQVILTTAIRGDLKYLDDQIGWGVASLERALKGPSDFNAGLIEEQKFFRGNLSRITDKEGNLYFYVDIKKDGNYSFDNDIAPSLTGTVNDGDATTYEIDGVGQMSNGKIEQKRFHYRLPKVLDSEKNFYASVKTAGLRKDGEGTLVLNGKQKYTDKTLLEQGTIELNNNSESTYNVYEKGTLIIGKEVKEKEKELTLNRINNKGKVDFQHNATLKEFYGDKKSTTNLKTGIKITAERFKTNGTISVDVDSDNLKDLIWIKKDNNKTNIDKNSLTDAKLENIYLTTLLKEDKDYVKLSIIPTLDVKYFNKRLKELERKDLRNIPSYNYNESTFFKEYLDGDYYSYHRSGKLTLDTPTKLALLNLKGDEKEVKSKVFTDLYNNFFNNIIESSDVRLSQNDQLIDSSEDKDNLAINTYHNTNVIKKDNSDAFTKYSSVNSLSKKFNINNNFVTNISAVYEKDIYSFNDDSKFNNDAFSLGNDTKLKLNVHKLILSNYLTFNNTKVNRKFLDNKFVKNTLNSLIFENTFTYAVDFRIKDINTLITPYISNNIRVLNVFAGDKEQSNEDKNYLKTTIENTLIFNDSISAGVNFKTFFNDKLNLSSNLKVEAVVTNINPTLNVKTGNTKHKSKGDALDRFKFNFNNKLNYKINDKVNLDVRASINSRLRVGLGLGVNISI